MRFIKTFPLLTLLVAPALCQDEVASIVSEIAPIITDLPSIVMGEASVLISDLEELFSTADPTGVVSDLPAFIATEVPAVESIIGDLITAVIPLTVLPSDIAAEISAEIPAFISEVVPEILPELDLAITKVFPGTLSDAAIPTSLASLLSGLITEVESVATEILPLLSELLGGTLPTQTTTPTITTHIITTRTITASPFSNITTSIGFPNRTTGPLPSLTGAAAATTWKAEIAGIMAFAALVVLL